MSACDALILLTIQKTYQLLLHHTSEASQGKYAWQMLFDSDAQPRSNMPGIQSRASAHPERDSLP